MVDQTASALMELLSRYASGEYRDSSNIRESMRVFGLDGVIDESLAVLDALCAIEEHYGISIPDEDLTEDLFASVGSLSAYVGRKIADAQRDSNVSQVEFPDDGSRPSDVDPS